MFADANSSNDFILRRLTESFPFTSQTSSGWMITCAALVLLALGSAAWSLRRTTRHSMDYVVAALRGLIFLIPAALIGAGQLRGGSLDSLVPNDEWSWVLLTAGLLALGILLTVCMYIRDSASVGFWSVFLAPLRILAYVTLAFAFLLPSCQRTENTVKSSRVVVLIDVSPSMTKKSDDIAANTVGKPKTRLEKTIDMLTDESVALIQQIRGKNPISIYRFGTRLDEDNGMMKLASEEGAWTRSDYEAWLKYDFKHEILRKWPKEILDEVQTHEAWKAAEPGTPDWAMSFAAADIRLPETMKDRDTHQATLNGLLKKLKDRVDAARSIALGDDAQDITPGTNVPDSLLAALSRESSNMVQGIILISDGRSNMGAEASIQELRERAQRERIPVFTITVGEARDNIAITITDLQGPEIVQPDDPVTFSVEADGVGLVNQTVTARLQFYLPGKDPKKDECDYEMTKELKFAPGEPPHGMVQFALDPDELAKDELGRNLIEPSKKTGRKFQLKSGGWYAVARIARDNREAFADPDHVSPPRPFQVIDKPLRVLLFSSGPSRDYQTLRTFFVREMQERRAEVSIYLQMEGGATGEIVQDVPPERLLTNFPDRLDTTRKTLAETPEGKLAKYYNLDEYDLIIALDPDWNERDKAGNFRISDAAIANVKTWVNNLGGGLFYVAGPVHTFQLAATDQQVGRLKPLLEVLPVLPDDKRTITQHGVPREPRRLGLKPNPEAPEILKLEDGRIDTAGWERYFTGREEFRRSERPGEDDNPTRGFYAYYPVKQVKPGAIVWAEFWSIQDRTTRVPKPYLITTNSGTGRSGYLGSGETYRLRAENPGYFDRFWLNFGRYLSAKREAKASRGRILMSKEFISGGPVRVQARLLSPSGEPYAENAVQPKIRIDQYDGKGDRVKQIDLVEMKPRKSGEKFEGYYNAQFNADPRRFPLGDFRYRISLDVPDSAGDVLEADFILRKSNPELDNRKPDFAAMQTMAGSFKEIRNTNIEPEALRILLPDADLSKPDSPETNAAKERTKLAYKLAESDKIRMIPKCLDTETKTIQTIGAPDDLWDKTFEELIDRWTWLQSKSSWLRTHPLEEPKIRAAMREPILGIPLWIVIAGPLAMLTLLLFVLSTRLYNTPGQVVRMAALFLGVATAFVVFLAFYFKVGAVIFIVATLLSLEWLSRKLLRLA